MDPDMVTRRDMPQEERLILFGSLVLFDRPLHEIERARQQVFLDGFHAFLGQRTRVLDLLLADHAPARIVCLVKRIRLI